MVIQINAKSVAQECSWIKKMDYATIVISMKMPRFVWIVNQERTVRVPIALHVQKDTLFRLENVNLAPKIGAKNVIQTSLRVMSASTDKYLTLKKENV